MAFFSKTIQIEQTKIGHDEPVFIIAEIGANHNQDPKIAKQLIDCAVEAGCNAVKFQSFTIENWLSFAFDENKTYTADMLRKYELPSTLYFELQSYCREKKIICFSTPSHIEDIEELEKAGIPAYKFGSVQITDLPTIAHAATKGKPIILSGGACTHAEIERAIETVRECGNSQLAFLHCTSIYPVPDYRLLNLNILKRYQNSYRFPVGYSDHTTNPIIAPVAAVALGASIIEKHITLNRKMEGPDHPFAIEPNELKEMVKAIRETEAAMGSYSKDILPEEQDVVQYGRRSLIAKQTIEAGMQITKEMITIKRPGTGIEPGNLSKIIGLKASRKIDNDEVMQWDMFQ